MIKNGMWIKLQEVVFMIVIDVIVVILVFCFVMCGGLGPLIWSQNFVHDWGWS